MGWKRFGTRCGQEYLYWNPNPSPDRRFIRTWPVVCCPAPIQSYGTLVERKQLSVHHQSVSVLPSYQRLLRRVKARWRGTPLAVTCVTQSISGVKVTSINIDGDSKV